MDNQKIIDSVATEYNDLMQENLGAYGKDVSYYAEYKIKLISRIKKNTQKPNTILEFGCGIGRNIKYFQQYFPDSEIVGCDISQESLKEARKANDAVRFATPTELLEKKEVYDLIFVANVLHHIVPEKRGQALSEFYALLEERGELIIFEHNPYNLLTVHAVNTCPFDEGVVLLKPKEMKQLALGANFQVRQNQYSLFFPSALKMFAPLERFLFFLPVGGQYFFRLIKRSS